MKWINNYIKNLYSATIIIKDNNNYNIKHINYINLSIDLVISENVGLKVGAMSQHFSMIE